MTATGFSYSGVATQNLSTNVHLPSSLQVRSSRERNKGIHVKAEGEKRIVVYGLNYRPATPEAFLALPCNHLPIEEYDYYVVTYNPDPAFIERNSVLIIGCEDNTEVSTGQSNFVILNQLHTYLIDSTMQS